MVDDEFKDGECFIFVETYNSGPLKDILITK